MELTRRTPRRRHCLRIGAAAVAIAAGVGASVSLALADTTAVDPFGSGSVFTDLQLGNTADDVGDVWVNRAASTDGSGETLRVRIDVIDPGQIDESSVCIQATPFTDRDLGEGGCDGVFVQQADTGSFADYEIDLGAVFVGEVLYAQIHVTLTGGQLGGTAFGGWLPGNPFYGNIEVPDPILPIVPAECDEGMDGSDLNANGVIDDGECKTPIVPIVPAICAEGMVGSDLNANGVIDDGECKTRVVDPIVDPVVIATVNPVVGTSSVVHLPEVANVVVATTPAAPVVLGVLLEKPVPAAAAAPVVAGRLTSLPRTGLDTGVLVSLGGVLLLLGSALVGAAHRSKGVVISG